MLDVHPPHHAATTWRDFFIHIATICVGLLIAIGLEQTVEALHHRHERADLIQKMQSEAESDTRILQGDVRFGSAQVVWMHSVLTLLLQAKPVDGTVTVTLPALPQAAGPAQPAHSVWAVAKTNGTAALVPDDLASIYNHVDYEADVELKAQDVRTRMDEELHADEARFQLSLQPRATLHLTVVERDELAHDLARDLMAGHDNLVVAAVWTGCDDAIAHGVRDRDTIDSYVLREVASLPSR
ncbi:MAG TPA: hypothetical protein VIJ79_04465 [Acidobacteriaceae bacterium]